MHFQTENRKLKEQLSKKQAIIERQRNQVERLRQQIVDVRNIDPIFHNTAESMDKFFERIEDRSTYIEFGEALRRLVNEHHISLEGKTIVDFGVGPAIALSVLVEGYEPKKIVGYDFSDKALDYARTQVPTGKFHKCDIYEGDRQRYDLVLCTEVLEHLERPARALRSLLEMVGDNGIALITVPDGRSDRSKYHINFWSPESWKIFVEENALGFKGEVGTFKAQKETLHRHNFAILQKE